MSRLLFAAVTGVLTLALTGPAQAHGVSRSGNVAHVSTFHTRPSYNFSMNHSFAQRYGTRFSHGYYFGRNNFYWNSRCWSSRYGCYCYWCPYVNCWYYWCAPQCCYYPISYVTIAPPTVVVTTPSVTVATPGPAAPGGAMPPAGPPVP
jgi:hypothetical protein